MLRVSPRPLCRRPEIWADEHHHLSPGAPEPLEPGPAWPLQPRSSPAAAWDQAWPSSPWTGRAPAERPGRSHFTPPPEGHPPELRKEKAGSRHSAPREPGGRCRADPACPPRVDRRCPRRPSEPLRAPQVQRGRGAAPRGRPRVTRLRAETAALPPVSRVLSADVAAAITAGGGTAARGTDASLRCPLDGGPGAGGCGHAGKAGHWGAGAGAGPGDAKTRDQGVRPLNRHGARVWTTDLNSSWMAGSTGTAERGEETLISLSWQDPRNPATDSHPEGGVRAQTEGFCRTEVTPVGDREHGRTSDPFGPRAMPLLLGVHLHLQGEKAVSVLPAGHSGTVSLCEVEVSRWGRARQSTRDV